MALAAERPATPDARPRPRSPSDLFWSFTCLPLQGFGGVLAVVQRELVERKRWMSNEEFVEDWAVAQVMPGPNVVNLSIMIGDRYFGLRGALAALAGMLTFPLVLVLVLAVVYARFSSHPAVAGALRGMGGVAAWPVHGTGAKRVALRTPHPALRHPRADGAAPLAAVLDPAGARGRGLRADLEKARAMPAAVQAAQAVHTAQTLPLAAFVATDWINLLLYYMSLSLLTVGGAIGTTPEMHRFLVERQGWLTDLQFNASI